MRGTGAYGKRRWIAAIAVAAGLALTGVVSAPHALAAGPNITGVVDDTSGNPQADVAVNVLDPNTDATDATTHTGSDGTFTVSVASGTYNLQFIPPSSYGLESYLATGVSTGGPPLTVILKTATVVQVQGTLEDSEGHVDAGATVRFASPLNPGTNTGTDSSGHFSSTLLADQNFTVNAYPNYPGYSAQYQLPVGTLDQNETYNVVLPVSTLTVSVRDASGNPVTNGTINFANSSISPLPGIPGSSGTLYPNNGTALDANGNAALVVPNGITLHSLAVSLSNGLVLPFTLSAINGDRHVFLIFNGGSVIVGQPPTVTGAPDRAPDMNGWYNAPVTITWTSVSAPGNPGPPTTPSPTIVSADGANQVITSGKSCDPAGDCGTGTVTGINVDTTAPSVSVTGVTSGTTYGQAPTPGCATSDALSGVATNAAVSVANSGTSYTATCSGATDEAGNTAAPVSVAYQVIPNGYTTASLTDSSGSPIAGAAVTFRSAGGSVTNATTGADGIASATLTPGTYSVTMNYATGYQTKTITVTAAGPNTVSFATVAVTAQVSYPSSADLAAATVEHAGNTGTYGSKIPVDANGMVVFQVLPGTNTFIAFDAGGYQAKTVSVTGATTVTFATVAVTVQISDPNSADLAAASAAHAGNIGAFGPKTPVDGNGEVTFQVLPGTSTFTAYDAGGYQTQTVTITGAATVTFATVTVTVTVLKNGSPLTTATVTHAGNIGAYGPKTAVDGNGEVIFQVLPGTNSFTAWDGTAYQTETLTVTSAESTSISVA